MKTQALIHLIVPLLFLPLGLAAAEPQLIRVLPKAPVTGFGSSIALSHKWLVVGSEFGDDDAGVQCGRVDVYAAATGKWVRRLVPQIRTANQAFGFSCAINGDIVLIGAPGENSLQGAVYTFNIATGKQISKFVHPIPGQPLLLGYSVALEGNTAVAGAPDKGKVLNVNYLQSTPGRAVVFRADANILLQDLVPGTGNLADAADAGTTVAINGGIVAVGAPSQNNTGSVYTFDALSGVQQTRYTASDAMAAGKYGRSITPRGNGFLVGADQDAVYQINCQTQSETRRIPAPVGAVGFEFGQSVAATGSLGIVGEPGAQGGRVFFFNLADGSVMGSFVPSQMTIGVGYGHRTAVCGSRMAVLAKDDYVNDAITGAVYLSAALTGPEPLTNLAVVSGPAPQGDNTTLSAITEGYSYPASVAGFVSKLAGPDSNAGKDSGLFVNATGIDPAMYRIAKSRRQLPDYDAALPPVPNQSINFTLGSVFNLRTNVAGPTAIFQTTLTGPGINSTNNQGIGRWDSVIVAPINDTVTLMKRSGEDAAVPGDGKIKSFLHLVQSHKTPERDIAVALSLRTGVDGITTASDSAVVIYDTEGFNPALNGAREGKVEPGSAALLGQITPVVAFPRTYCLFVAARQTATTENQALFGIDRTGNGGPLIKRGDAVFGATVKTVLGGNTDAIDGFIGRVTLQGAGITTANNEALMLVNPDDIQKGMNYPDQVPSVQWNRFLGVHPARGSGLIIHATVSGPGVNATNDGVVAMVDQGGFAMHLLREGEPLPGATDGAKIGSILKVDTQPGATQGNYLILVSLIGGASDANQALLTGTSSLGNNVTRTPKRPFLMLRKGQLVDHPLSTANKVRSITLLGSNTNTQGMGGTGLSHWINNTGGVVMQVEWDSKLKELTRGQW